VARLGVDVHQGGGQQRCRLRQVQVQVGRAHAATVAA
jgi:hypothetical protein